ncbi:MAG: hypothetical protein WBD56_03750 [Anaerolineales bacterium]
MEVESTGKKSELCVLCSGVQTKTALPLNLFTKTRHENQKTPSVRKIRTGGVFGMAGKKGNVPIPEEGFFGLRQ